MTEQLSCLPTLDDAEHASWLLNGMQGVKNDCGVYVEVNLCAEGDFVLYEFSYFTGTYGRCNPLCRPCLDCHRNNSAEFLAQCIYNVFMNSVVPYDKNIADYPKESKELIKLCKKACDRIAKEIK